MDTETPTRRKPRAQVLARAMQVAATAIPIALCGCSNLSLYFHNDAYEKATSDTKDAVDKLDVAAAFKSLKDDTDSLASTEDQAAIVALAALRNETLARLVDPNKGDWLPLGPTEAGITFDSTSDGARRRLEYMIRTEMRRLIAEPNDQTYPNWKDGKKNLEKKTFPDTGQTDLALKYLAEIELADAAAADTEPLKMIADAAIAEAKIKNAPGTDCDTAAKLADRDDPIPGAPDASLAYHTLADACAKSIATEFYKTLLTGAGSQGRISVAAGDYLSAVESQQAARQHASEQKATVEALLRAIKGDSDAADAAQKLKEVISYLEQGEALAKTAGLTEVDNFLKCGLLTDLNSIETGLGNVDAAGGASGGSGDAAKASGAAAPAASATAAPAGTGTAATTTASAGSTTGTGGAGGKAPASTPAAAPAAAAKTTDDCTAAFATAGNDKAIATVIGAVMKVSADAAATDRLKRIDANIVALGKLQQDVSTAQATVEYDQKRLLLFKGRLLALLTEYRLLVVALNADLALPTDSAVDGLVSYRNDKSHGRNAALALSAYAASWNYGRIADHLIDFRFVQARRQFDVQISSLTASNYKALVQPIADALLAYGKGGITPDMLAQVLSNLGIMAAFLGK
jgi:hypothetical protein